MEKISPETANVDSGIAERKDSLAKRKFRKFDAYKGAWLRYAERYVLLLAVLFVIFRFVIGVSLVSGDSMHPTLKNGSAVVYGRIANHFEVGDILAIKMAYGEYYIKRVAALPGDIVDLDDGVLTVNGVPENGDYVFGRTDPEETLFHYPYTVPENHLFVLGDNRAVSVDSRTFGAVAYSQIQGKVIAHFG